jgi:hypothetical protein
MNAPPGSHASHAGLRLADERTFRFVDVAVVVARDLERTLLAWARLDALNPRSSLSSEENGTLEAASVRCTWATFSCIGWRGLWPDVLPEAPLPLPKGASMGTLYSVDRTGAEWCGWERVEGLDASHSFIAPNPSL